MLQIRLDVHHLKTNKHTILIENGKGQPTVIGILLFIFSKVLFIHITTSFRALLHLAVQTPPLRVPLAPSDQVF